MMDGWATQSGQNAETTELSVVDAVLWACEQSEDETEVGDLVEAVLHRDDVVVRREHAAPARSVRHAEPTGAIATLS